MIRDKLIVLEDTGYFSSHILYLMFGHTFDAMVLKTDDSIITKNLSQDHFGQCSFATTWWPCEDDKISRIDCKIEIMEKDTTVCMVLVIEMLNIEQWHDTKREKCKRESDWVKIFLRLYKHIVLMIVCQIIEIIFSCLIIDSCPLLISYSCIWLTFYER